MEIKQAEWQEKMERLISTAKYLSHCDVLDISFTNGDIWEVYIAISREQRVSGLAEVSSLDLDGMLFVYDPPVASTPFSMKKMLIDLDIAWFDSSGKMLDLQTHKAGNQNPIWPDRKNVNGRLISYVLEAKAGTMPESDLVVKNG